MFIENEEVRDWILPSEYDHAENEARHLLDSCDNDSNGSLSKEEIIRNHDIFVGSQATGKIYCEDYFGWTKCTHLTFLFQIGVMQSSDTTSSKYYATFHVEYLQRQMTEFISQLLLTCV